ncbi:MAG: hypothetical protein JWN96_514 [Mycobacterium sp.]|nr:hypothetical protein [Mycobacterium sp.]
MSAGIVSAAALCASGLAGVFTPESVGEALELPPTTARGKTEVRAGLGGTYAALGAWALVDRSPAADYAVGVTWLGAAAARLASLRLDRPRTNATYWLYLAAEVGLGATAVASARKGVRS